MGLLENVSSLLWRIKMKNPLDSVMGTIISGFVILIALVLIISVAA